MIRKLNRSARKCYQSKPKGPDENLVRNIIKSGHTSVLEHASFTLDIITDRGVLAELTRHRMAGYSVESTRYCNYGGKEITFIEPITIKDNEKLYDLWRNQCLTSEMAYKQMRNAGAEPQEARQVLNNSLKCEIRMTVNIRSLRNVFSLRCAKGAHPHIKQLFIPLLLWMQDKYGVLFEDITYDQEFAKKYLTDWKNYCTIDTDGESMSIDDKTVSFKRIELSEDH